MPKNVHPANKKSNGYHTGGLATLLLFRKTARVAYTRRWGARVACHSRVVEKTAEEGWTKASEMDTNPLTAHTVQNTLKPHAFMADRPLAFPALGLVPPFSAAAAAAGC